MFLRAHKLNMATQILPIAEHRNQAINRETGKGTAQSLMTCQPRDLHFLLSFQLNRFWTVLFQASRVKVSVYIILSWLRIIDSHLCSFSTW